jgi:N-acetylglucosaminyl-diphospho-decaprenol L-rhamnosyltransferase
VSPRLTAIVVNHRSAAEAAACVASLREAFRRETIAGEIVLVDCASGPEEVRTLEALPADARVFLEENRGYSGGVNAGLARAESDRLLLSNADVVFGAGALTELLSAIESPGAGAAAPLCFWDTGGKLRLPAESGPTFFGELGWRSFPAHARRALQLWNDGGDARHLVGAVLAARRDVFDRVGRFDERFLFEYEESEWEDRVRAAGLALRFAPKARVRHLFARSALRNPETERRRSVSRRLYRERRWGRAGRWLIERRGARAPHPSRALRIAEPAVAARAGAWVAVSTNSWLVPFAGAPLNEDFRLPADVLESLPPGPVYLRAFRETDGRPLETFVWEKP